ncbi:hypothetical protein Tco_0908258 [Tanacetum coccineum]|uniref:Uncharacterized protein n=1 Tax=Tanacetum coccineum TaxID=301880 RepID=A0ABQ5CME3_9ASTR
MTLENKKTVNAEAEAEAMNHLNPNPTPQQPSLHLNELTIYILEQELAGRGNIGNSLGKRKLDRRGNIGNRLGKKKLD